MLQQVELYSALGKAEQNNLFAKLEQIYANLPRTSCDGCATCCKWGSPPAFFIEYLNMYRYVRDNMKKDWLDILKKSTEYFYLELVDVNQKCPFLNDDNNCSIYNVRPFSCRSYGLLSKKDFETGDRGLKKLAQKFKDEYDLTIPEEIINYELPWCGKVVSDRGSYLEKSTLAGLAAQIGSLDYTFFPQELVDQEGTLLPYPVHLMNAVLGTGARSRKIKVMKQFVDEGSKELLNHFVEKASSFQF
ncbi:Putative zinc-or iron-chelating domain-containing protein [Desulforamulus putei DSM 12395]|uniref:Putative zinc-or iron-chelating domain-containing protein n=1 Tax=Desulforamulus putei DSM 12395 TaxID=1121429 RepID=A0A1M4XCJ5_9FIRM|nr:YkgJ family cysteine cluster protein [Desulforamulus putei]SHE91143.1 Putative zinc-or iron-chelating domain-containing protein [Desulforamulus putei DSM 12395]